MDVTEDVVPLAYKPSLDRDPSERRVALTGSVRRKTAPRSADPDNALADLTAEQKIYEGVICSDQILYDIVKQVYFLAGPGANSVCAHPEVNRTSGKWPRIISKHRIA